MKTFTKTVSDYVNPSIEVLQVDLETVMCGSVQVITTPGFSYDDPLEL